MAGEEVLVYSLLQTLIGVLYAVLQIMLGVALGYYVLVPENKAKIMNSLFRKNMGVLHIIRKGSRIERLVVNLNSFKIKDNAANYSLEIPKFNLNDTGEATYPKEKEFEEYYKLCNGVPYLFVRDDDFRLFPVGSVTYVSSPAISPEYLGGIFDKQQNEAERLAALNKKNLQTLIYVVLFGLVLNLVFTFITLNAAGDASKGAALVLEHLKGVVTPVAS